MIPNSRDTDSRSSPRSRRSTVARLRRAENRPLRSRSAAAPVALRALSAAVDSSPCCLISTLLLRELSRNHVSKKTLGRRIVHVLMLALGQPWGDVRDMTRAEISRATELARACMASNYQDCAA